MSSTPAPSDEEVRERIAAVPHWYHQIEVRPGIVTPGINDSAGTLEHLELPQDCTGLRALDIGARDGYFSFELERRGAEVVAIDYMDPGETGFPVARELLGSQVEFQVENLYDLDPERHGTFDIVLFLGVLYHLRDPLLALDRIWGVCSEDALLALETQVLEDAVLLPDGSFRTLRSFDPVLDEVALAQFYPGDSLRGDHTNYWSPNAACMRGLLQDAGFTPVSDVVEGARGVFHARRAESATTTYFRRLEKSTPREVAPPADPPATAAEAAHLEAALASAQYRQRASDDELASARQYIASLEETVARKDRELEEALAFSEQALRTPAPAPGPPPSVLRRAAAAFERRRR